MHTVKDLTDYMTRNALSPERLARRIKISNMTIRRLLRREPATPIPDKYQTLLKLNAGTQLFQGEGRTAALLASLTGGTPGEAGQAANFDAILTDLESSGATAAGDSGSLAQLDDDVEVKLEDRAIGTSLRQRARKIRALLKAGTLTLKDKAILAGALLYLVNPVDLIPDAIPVVGYLDDLAVLTLATDVVVRNVKRRADKAADTES